MKSRFIIGLYFDGWSMVQFCALNHSENDLVPAPIKYTNTRTNALTINYDFNNVWIRFEINI